MFGKCCSCNTEIIKIDRQKQKVTILPNYRDAYLYLTDGSIMRVGVCDKCQGTIEDDDKMVKKIMKKHRDFWSTEAELDDKVDTFTKARRKARIANLETTLVGKDKNIIKAKIKQYEEG